MPEHDDEVQEVYVTWKAFVAIGLPAIAVPIVVTWALLVFHSAQPHAGAVRTHELSRISDQIKSVESEMREIRRLIIERSNHGPWTQKDSELFDSFTLKPGNG